MDMDFDYTEYSMRMGEGASHEQAMEHAIAASRCNHIKTPRGTFRFRFATMAEAQSAGYNLWFSHKGANIVSNGTLAVAVYIHA